MKLLRSQTTARARHSRPFLLNVLLLLSLLSSICPAQRSSGAATFTLTATLSQALSMSVAPDAVESFPFSNSLADAQTTANSPLTVTARWVRGPASVSMQAFSPANPLLGPAGRGKVLVGTAFPSVPHPLSPAGENFLPPAPDPLRSGLPALQIDTKNLQIPPGSEGATLTIRAEVL
jgi:hypothetical protein